MGKRVQEACKRIVRNEHIDCDLTECDAYVYAADEERLGREVDAARRLGIDASLERELEIPIACAG